MQTHNLNFRNCSLLLDYLFTSNVVFLFPFNLLFVEKVDYRVDFYKNISDSPEDIKDERIPNKIIK